MDEEQLKHLPSNILGLARTENVQQLASIYSAAEVFINPTYSDNFPTTNIEALACGTPVITYDTGGSPEAVDEQTGVVVPKGNHLKLVDSVEELSDSVNDIMTDKCRNRALACFNKEDRFFDYLKYYKQILKSNV